MSNTAITDEEFWGFDVCGYLVVCGALSADELRRAGADGEPVDWLAELPITLNYVEALCGPGARLDQPVRPVEPFRGACGEVLAGGNVPWNPSRGYFWQVGGARQCQSLRVVWALGDPQRSATSDYAIVAASHKSELPAPVDVLAGREQSALTRPALWPGDMLLHAGTALHGNVPAPGGGDGGRLAGCEFAGFTTARPAESIPLPEWTNDLSPEQRAIFTGDGVNCDGERCWPRDGKAVNNTANLGVIHNGDDDRIGPPDEVWWWDTFGYLLLRGVMSPDWVGAANAALDANMDKLSPPVPEWTDKDETWSPRLRGTPHRGIGGLFTLTSPYCDVFRRGMIAHRAVVRRLNWMLGPRWRCDPRNEPGSTHWEAGTAGINLHAGHSPASGVGGARPEADYRYQGGRCYGDQVNVAWQLSRCGPEDGGFVCIKGSHKASHPMPWPDKVSIDIEQVEHVATEPGDIMFFLGSGQTHGAWGWRGQHPRRTAIMRFHTFPTYPAPKL